MLLAARRNYINLKILFYVNLPDVESIYNKISVNSKDIEKEITFESNDSNYIEIHKCLSLKKYISNGVEKCKRF